MRNELRSVKVWSIHLTLALLVSLWLTVTEYVLDVPFAIVLVVLIALVVAAAALTHIRIDRVTQCYRRAMQAANDRARTAKEDLQLVVRMQSAARAIFVHLYPNRAAGTYGQHNMGDYEYGRWLWWALQRSNLMEWLRTYRHIGGTQLPALRGVLDHIPDERRGEVADELLECMRYTRGIESILRETESMGRPAGGTPDEPPAWPLITDYIPTQRTAQEETIGR